MRISKSHFFVEFVAQSNVRQPTGFRYRLYDLTGEQETLVYESHLFRHKSNCVAKGAEHLERVISWENLNSRPVASAS
jgi:hypothetical protein